MAVSNSANAVPYATHPWLTFSSWSHPTKLKMSTKTENDWNQAGKYEVILTATLNNVRHNVGNNSNTNVHTATTDTSIIQIVDPCCVLAPSHASPNSTPNNIIVAQNGGT